MNLLFNASCQVKNNTILLREIARDVHSSLGDIDQVRVKGYDYLILIRLNKLAWEIFTRQGSEVFGNWSETGFDLVTGPFRRPGASEFHAGPVKQ